jgi:hypothetical protein
MTFELRPLCNVLRVNLDSDKKRAVSVTYIDARGREFEQPADLIILASYTFNNSRLMLLSGIGQPYDPVSNRGVIWRNSLIVARPRDDVLRRSAFNPFMGGGSRGTVIDISVPTISITGSASSAAHISRRIHPALHRYVRIRFRTGPQLGVQAGRKQSPTTTRATWCCARAAVA